MKSFFLGALFNYWFELDLNKHTVKEVYPNPIQNTVPLTTTTTTSTTTTRRKVNLMIGFFSIDFEVFSGFTHFVVKIPTSLFKINNNWIGIGFNSIKSMVTNNLFLLRLFHKLNSLLNQLEWF